MTGDIVALPAGALSSALPHMHQQVGARPDTDDILNDDRALNAFLALIKAIARGRQGVDELLSGRAESVVVIGVNPMDSSQAGDWTRVWASNSSNRSGER